MAIAMHVVAGTPTTGLWCPKCLLPSVIEVPLGFLTLNGYTSMPSHVFCHDCGAHFCGRCIKNLVEVGLICSECRGGD